MVRGRHGSSLPPLPGRSRAPPDLDSSDSSLRSDDDDSILGLFLLPPPHSNTVPQVRESGATTTWAGRGEHHCFPAPPRVLSRGSILGSRVLVSGFHLREGPRFVALCLWDLPLFLTRIPMIAPGPLRLCVAFLSGVVPLV